MEAATERRRVPALSASLAGVQAGMVGACWMLVWLGITAKWQLRSFWTSANLMASVFYGSGSIRSGFAWSTVTGVALYLLLYGLLGALFAVALQGKVTGKRAVLMGMLCAVVWYYLTFRLLWKSLMPLVALLHTETPTVLEHLIYGAILGRFPVYLNRLEPPPEEPPAAELPAELPPSTDDAAIEGPAETHSTTESS